MRGVFSFPFTGRNASRPLRTCPTGRTAGRPEKSVEHKRLKEAWYLYLRSLPFFGEITWNCRECSNPHTYDLLHGATAVVMEQRLQNTLRPDLAILGSAGKPIALLEFRKSNLSDRVWQYATEEGIPLFVIDVLDGESEQPTLHNRQRRWYDHIPEFDEESRRMARLAESFPATVFEPFHNSSGDLVDAFLHYNNEDASTNAVLSLMEMPKPRRGHYLFAHESTLGCESQRPARMPWLFPEAAAS